MAVEVPLTLSAENNSGRNELLARAAMVATSQAVLSPMPVWVGTSAGVRYAN